MPGRRITADDLARCGTSIAPQDDPAYQEGPTLYLPPKESESQEQGAAPAQAAGTEEERPPADPVARGLHLPL